MRNLSQVTFSIKAGIGKYPKISSIFFSASYYSPARVPSEWRCPAGRGVSPGAWPGSLGCWGWWHAAGAGVCTHGSSASSAAIVTTISINLVDFAHFHAQPGNFKLAHFRFRSFLKGLLFEDVCFESVHMKFPSLIYMLLPGNFYHNSFTFLQFYSWQSLESHSAPHSNSVFLSLIHWPLVDMAI